MLQPGHLLGNRYQVIKALGQGGQSNVYLIQDTRLKGKKWVAKEMVAQYTDPKDQAQAKVHFEREAQLLATLDHPNLPKVTDFFTEAGKHYLIMEYVAGEDLGSLLQKRQKPFSEEEVAGWAIQIATVLYYLHKQNPPVVFRDIKPSNIMLEGGMAKLIDFGIARLFNPTKKGDTLRIGSPGYSPPEQYSGQTDPRSDIYSLGVTMHHLLTNQDPSRTQTPFKIPPIKAFNPKVSPKMIYIVEKATQMDPDKRYQNALELKNDLKEIIAGGKTQLTPLPPGAMTVPQPHGMTIPVTPQVTTGTVPVQGTQIPAVVRTEEDKSQDQSAAQSPQGQAQTGQVSPTQQGPVKKGSFIGFLGTMLTLAIIVGSIYLLFMLLTGRIQLPDIVSKLLPKKPVPIATSKPVGNDPLDKGIAFYEKGQYRDAINELEKARERDKKSPVALMYLNNALIKEAKSEYINIGIFISSPSSGSTPAQSPTAKSDTSGNDLSNYNTFLSGAVLAQQRVNFEGGIKGKQIILNLYTLSGEQKKDEFIISSVFNNNPVAVLADLGENSLKSVKKTAEMKKTPVLTYAPMKEDNNSSVLSFSLSRKAETQALLQYVVKSKISPVSIVYSMSTPTDITDVFLKQMYPGLKISGTYSYQPDKMNLEKTISDLKKKPQAGIITLGQEPDILFLISSIRKAGIKTKIYLPSYLSTPELIDRLKIKEPNLVGINTLYYWPENYNTANFMGLYQDAYDKSQPDIKSSYSYDFVWLITFAGRKTSPESEKILTFLTKDEANKKFEGVLGSLKIKYEPKTSSSIGEFIPEWWGVITSSDATWKQSGGFKTK
jgi:serine/threonine protein kinase